ncbi:MAG: hypothetical protein II964_00335 [Synergistaceae bacterium]|nr:hypothetical protein [Synergistaceae bacterium]
MKRFMITVMILLVICAVSYGAETADSEIYVRKEVFNAHIDSLNSKMDSILREMKQMRDEMKQMREETREEIKEIKEELKSQREEIKSIRQDLSEIARAVSVLSQRIDGLEARLGDTQNYLYLLLVLLGIIVALPFVQRFLEWKDSRKPSITLEDVKRLIEESKSEARSA